MADCTLFRLVEEGVVRRLGGAWAQEIEELDGEVDYMTSRQREAARIRKPHNRSERPLPAGVRDNGRRYSPVQRAQCLTLLALGIKRKEIHHLIGVPVNTQGNILKKATERGYNPAVDFRVGEHHVEDSARSGRPREVEEEARQALVDSVKKDRAGREKSAEVLAYKAGISHSTALRILRDAGLRSVKPTTKPGLTKKQRATRLQFCLDHQHWTLEDWKKVVFTDETSGILGHRRGAVQLWRTTKEQFKRSAIRERWKGYSEFMAWACFTYNRKGPMHIWEPETARERATAAADLRQLNEELEPAAKVDWELANAARRMNLRKRTGGRAPVWRFTEKTGKLIRNGKGGIDWYRYWKVILENKLFPFIRSCGPDVWVLEDGAPAHKHHHNIRLYNIHAINRLLWPGNSPDLNAIEKAWPWLKRETTIKGATSNRHEMKRRWLQAWDDLPQRNLQVWVEGVMANIKKVIELEGGNEYQKGRNSKQAYRGLRIVGHLTQHGHHRERQTDATMRLEAILNPADDDDKNDVNWQDLEDNDNEDDDGH